MNYEFEGSNLLFCTCVALAISTFQIVDDNHLLRMKGDRNALWFFIIAILSMICIGIQNYSFAAAAANLTHKLRVLTFRAILRQDSRSPGYQNERTDFSDDVDPLLPPQSSFSIKTRIA